MAINHAKHWRPRKINPQKPFLLSSKRSSEASAFAEKEKPFSFHKETTFHLSLIPIHIQIQLLIAVENPSAIRMRALEDEGNNQNIISEGEEGRVRASDVASVTSSPTMVGFTLQSSRRAKSRRR
jgi:hypothetical protein